MPAMISRFAIAALALAGGFGTAMGSTVEEEADAYLRARADDGSCPEIAKETLQAQRRQCPVGAHSWVSEAADRVECGRQVSVNGAPRVSRYNSTSNTCDDCVGGYDESNGNNGDCEEYTYCGNQLPVGNAAPVSRLTGVTPTTGPGSCAPCNTGSHDLTDANNNDCVAGPTCGNTYVLDTETGAYKAVSRLEPGADSTTAGRCVACDYGHFGPLDDDNNAPDCKCNERTACNLGEPEQCAYYRGFNFDGTVRDGGEYDAGCVRTDEDTGRSFLIKGINYGTYRGQGSTAQFSSKIDAFKYDGWDASCYDAKGQLHLYFEGKSDKVTCMKQHDTDSGLSANFIYINHPNNYAVDQSLTYQTSEHIQILNRHITVQELCGSGHGLSTGEYDDIGFLLRPVCKPSVDCQITGDVPTIENCTVVNPQPITQEFTPAQYGGDDSCSDNVVTERCAPVHCKLGKLPVADDCPLLGGVVTQSIATQPNILGDACPAEDQLATYLCERGDGDYPHLPCVVGVIREGDEEPYDEAVGRELEGTDCKRCGILLQDVIREATEMGGECIRNSTFCKTGDGAQGDLVCPMQEDELKSGMVLLRKSGNNYDIPRWFKIYGGENGAGFEATDWSGEEYTGFKIQYCQTPDHRCDAGATTHLGVGGPGDGHGFAYNYFPDGTGSISDTYWSADAASNVQNCNVVSGSYYQNQQQDGTYIDQVFKKQFLQSSTAEAWEILKADHNGGTGLYMTTSAGLAKGCPGVIHVKGCHDSAAGNYDSEANAYGGVNCCGTCTSHYDGGTAPCSSWKQLDDGSLTQVDTACDASFCGNQADGTSRFADGECADCAAGTWAFTSADDCVSYTTCGDQTDGVKRAPTFLDPEIDNKLFVCAACADGTWADNGGQNCQIGNSKSITSGFCTDFPGWRIATKKECEDGDLAFTGPGRPFWNIFSYTPSISSSGALGCIKVDGGSSADRIYYNDGNYGSLDSSNVECGATHEDGGTINFLGCLCVRDDFTYVPVPVNCALATPALTADDCTTDCGTLRQDISTQPRNNGDECPADVQCQPGNGQCGAVNCEGDYGPASHCRAEPGNTGTRTRAFVITIPKQYNGDSCDVQEGAIQSQDCVTFDQEAVSITLENVRTNGGLRFEDGNANGYPKVITLTTEAAGTASHIAQILTLNVKEPLPTDGASYRVYKSLGPNGNSDTSDPVDLIVGENEIYVDQVNFDRVVKIQFSSGDIKINGLAYNNVIQDIYDASAVRGCTDQVHSLNYNPDATLDDNSCVPRWRPAQTSACLEGGVITSLADCDLYRQWTGINVPAEESNDPTKPVGCYMGASIYFNTAPEPTGECNDVNLCLCKDPGPTLGPETLLQESCGIAVSSRDECQALVDVYASTYVVYEVAEQYQNMAPPGCFRDIYQGNTYFNYNPSESAFPCYAGPCQVCAGVSISDCGGFAAGPNNDWPKVLVATTLADGADSQGAQTFTMNVASLPAGGANFRVYKTTQNGIDFFGNPVALALGPNSITVGAVHFNRAVKFQFSSAAVEYSALTLNDVGVECDTEESNTEESSPEENTTPWYDSSGSGIQVGMVLPLLDGAHAGNQLQPRWYKVTSITESETPNAQIKYCPADPPCFSKYGGPGDGTGWAFHYFPQVDHGASEYSFENPVGVTNCDVNGNGEDRILRLSELKDYAIGNAQFGLPSTYSVIMGIDGQPGFDNFGNTYLKSGSEMGECPTQYNHITISGFCTYQENGRVALNLDRENCQVVAGMFGATFMENTDSNAPPGCSVHLSTSDYQYYVNYNNEDFSLAASCSETFQCICKSAPLTL